MEGPFEQFFEEFNEIMIFITTACVLCFSDAFADLELKRNAGSFACGIIFIMIIVNFGGFFINIYSKTRHLILKVVNLIKKKRSE